MVSVTIASLAAPAVMFSAILDPRLILLSARAAPFCSHLATVWQLSV
jgi:hypothetical protein